MLREATLEDSADILDVMFSTAMSKQSTWWKNTEQTIRQKLEQGGGFVYESDGRLNGVVGYVVDGDTITLRGLAVRPAQEKQRIGSALVRSVEQKGRDLGCARVLLAVSCANLEVVPYYEKLGYSKVNEPYAYTYPGRPDPVVMELRL